MSRAGINESFQLSSFFGRDCEFICNHLEYLKEFKSFHSDCKFCSKARECAQAFNLEFRHYDIVNATINNHEIYDEIILYNEEFKVLTDSLNLPKVERARKFETVNGITKPLFSDAFFSDYNKCQQKSSKRSLDNFYGYALNNDWEYFLTLTFSPDSVNRQDDNAVKNIWTKFLKELKYKCPDGKILLCPERHKKDGAFHFHGFGSNFDCLTFIPAINPKTGLSLKTSFADLIFNIKDWNFGFNSAVILPKDCNREKVVNYCAKYIVKENGNVGYNKKRYFRTYNLNFKEKYNYLFSDDLISKYIVDGYQAVKTTDRFTVFRKYNKGQHIDEKKF